jgi:hypothetical protein
VLAAFTGPTAPLHTDGWRLPAGRVHALLEQMRAEQRMFDQTGSLHAAGLAGPTLECLWVREDVGRHNAVDKVIGKALFEGLLPLTDHVLVVSGRVSYEIVHKALTAGVAALVAVSGPTTLAVDLAREGLEFKAEFLGLGFCTFLHLHEEGVGVVLGDQADAISRESGGNGKGNGRSSAEQSSFEKGLHIGLP